MNGRLEKELKIDQKIRNMIKDHSQNKILNSYYGSFVDESYSTRYTYMVNVITFLEYMKRNYNIDFNKESDIKRIKMLHINEYLNSYSYKKGKLSNEKNTNSYKALKLASVRHFYEFLVNNDMADTNLCDKIKKPKEKSLNEIISLTPEEIQLVKLNVLNGVGTDRAKSFQKKLTNRDLAIIFLGITTGLRISAICNINMEDVSIQNKTIRVIEKGYVDKYIYVPENVMNYIEKWIDDRSEILEYGNSDALFISLKQERISTSTVRKMLKKYTYNIDKNITPHKLRSTAATNLLEETGDIFLVAEVLGHKNIQNTRRYAKMSEEKKRNAASILGKLV